MNIDALLEKRRSIYNIGKQVGPGDDEIIALINRIVALVPDAFNMKSQRVVLALGSKHEALWDAVHDAFNSKIPREKTEGFKAGHGTVLYFYDAAVIEALQKQFPRYANNFPVWAQQSNGMLQIAIWTGLRGLGIGANIQHYNPVIDDAVKELFRLPQQYVLVAQMPFGGILQDPAPKESDDAANRVRIER